MRRLGSGVVEETAKSVMVVALLVVDEEADVERVRRFLKTHQGILATDGKKIVGIVTRSDLLKVLSEPI